MEYAELKRRFYGVREAASGWEGDYSKRLVNDGFQRGRAASQIFHHPKSHVRVVLHGGSSTFAASESELTKMRSRMCNWYNVKGQWRK